MSTHTPGPWQITRDKKYDQQRISSGDLPVAVTKAEANARLIAAAPELLRLLKTLELLLRDRTETSHLLNVAVEQARAAIAKAEG